MGKKKEMQAQSLSREDHLEEEMATHHGILALRIPWTEDPGGLQSMGFKELDMTEQVRTHTVCDEEREVSEDISDLWLGCVGEIEKLSVISHP